MALDHTVRDRSVPHECARERSPSSRDSSRPVVVLTVPFGSAHQRTAEALSQAWDTCPRPTRLMVIPVEAYVPRSLVSLLLHGYLTLITRAPRVFSFAYAKGREPGVSNRVLSAAIRVSSRAGRRLRGLVGTPPGIWVSTHPLTSVIALSASTPDAMLSVLVTDHHFHAFWCTPGADQFLVGRHEIRRSLVARGVPRGSVHMTGIPIDPCFGESVPRHVAEQRLSLPASSFRVLVMGGGLGIGPIEEIARRLTALHPAVHSVVVSGHNEKLRRRLALSGNGCTVYGYTDRIRDLMAASDICITKPGGLTIAEAAAAGLPTLLIDPLPGHEEANTETLVREGSAFRVLRAAQVADVVAELARRPRLLRRMGQRLGHHGRPLAAAEAAGTLEQLWVSRFATEAPSR